VFSISCLESELAMPDQQMSHNWSNQSNRFRKWSEIVCDSVIRGFSSKY